TKLSIIDLFLYGYKDMREWADVLAAILQVGTLAAFVLSMAVILYYIAKHLYGAKRTITFHRLTGEVEVPRPLFKGWNGATVRFPFTDERIKSFYHGATVFYISYPRSWWVIWLTAGRGEAKELSFFLWYMDRNRQLPPGKRLDPYRVKDFLRRESEGFPKPLRYAPIKMPSRKTVPPALRKERKNSAEPAGGPKAAATDAGTEITEIR
ncbi:MAG: hypothetical protein LIP00_02005, partial [Parabacteroides sp.]|nr:hypothetical protein [Parabacteroides sp.]